MGPLLLANLTTSNCLDLKTALKEKVSGKTRLNVMGLLHKAMADAHVRKLIASNPVPKLKMPKGWAKRLKKKSKPLTASEVNLFLGALPERIDRRDGAFVLSETLRDLYYIWFRTCT